MCVFGDHPAKRIPKAVCGPELQERRITNVSRTSRNSNSNFSEDSAGRQNTRPTSTNSEQKCATPNSKLTPAAGQASTTGRRMSLPPHSSEASPQSHGHRPLPAPSTKHRRATSPSTRYSWATDTPQLSISPQVLGWSEHTAPPQPSSHNAPASSLSRRWPKGSKPPSSTLRNTTS